MYNDKNLLEHDIKGGKKPTNKFKYLSNCWRKRREQRLSPWDAVKLYLRAPHHFCQLEHLQHLQETSLTSLSNFSRLILSPHLPSPAAIVSGPYQVSAAHLPEGYSVAYTHNSYFSLNISSLSLLLFFNHLILLRVFMLCQWLWVLGVQKCFLLSCSLCFLLCRFCRKEDDESSFVSPNQICAKDSQWYLITLFHSDTEYMELGRFCT